MEIQILRLESTSMNQRPFEIVERKGLGHPDTLADLIAEQFSNNYSSYCLKNFSGIPNHWVDKIVLSGAQANLDFGKYTIEKPITSYLFGKVTPSIGKTKIDIYELFQKSVKEIFTKIFGENSGILNHIKYIVDTNFGVGTDHPSDFYLPESLQSLPSFGSKFKSNDTVVTTGYANYSLLERIVIFTENIINSSSFKKQYYETGFDVKVLGIRKKNNVHLVICIPFLASKTLSYKQYQNCLTDIRKYLLSIVREKFSMCHIDVIINTKDKGEFAYLTCFGTALDKGDFGAVGRGNRYNGVIPFNRSISMEAVSGKNPLHHTGKLYTILAHEISERLSSEFNVDFITHLATFNGSEISLPEFVAVQADFDSISHSMMIENMIKEILSNIGNISKQIIESDPVQNHITTPRFINS